MVAAAQPASASLPALSVARLLEICTSASVADAAAKGDLLGWARMDTARMATWRNAYEQHNGPVDVVSWSRGPQEADGLLSFWRTRSVPGSETCAYSIGNAAGLEAELSQSLGPPTTSERSDSLTAVEWARDAHAVSFVQVGAGALVTVTSRP